VLWAYLGDPNKYHCAAAYRKAMGLNLKERSSGRYQGHLKITKRGPGPVRRWLYFAAMRWANHPDVTAWYQAKKGLRPKDGKRVLIAVMRKLAMGLHALGVSNEPFDAKRLFSPDVGRGVRRGRKSQGKTKRQRV
jgi:transposase